MIKYLIIIFYFIPTVLLAGNVPTKEELPNQEWTYYKQGPHLAIGGVPSKAILKALKKQGVSVIIDTRTPSENIAHYQRMVTELDLIYFNIPIYKKQISKSHIDRLEKLLEQFSDEGIYLHCASGNRASALWALVQLSHGAPIHETLKQAKKSGLKYGLEQFIKENSNLYQHSH